MGEQHFTPDPVPRAAATAPGLPEGDGGGPLVDLVFIHHSVGGQLLAEPGPARGANCIYESHPNGGALRRLLREQGYVIHEASYGSRVGDETDLLDWPGKFRDRMDDVLAVDSQDARLPAGRRNRVVLFKSCFPNNDFADEGAGGNGVTVARAREAYLALLDPFAARPDVVFVCLTTPPLAPRVCAGPVWKRIARAVMRRPAPRPPRPDGAKLARQFADWLKAEDGWLKDYPGRNVAVFDYYDVLTGDGAGDFAAFASRGGCDSHPTREGQQLAARRLVPVVNRAVARAGLSELSVGGRVGAGAARTAAAGNRIEEP